jgi:hypothetical protein
MPGGPKDAFAEVQAGIDGDCIGEASISEASIWDVFNTEHRAKSGIVSTAQ